jgi:predicted phosphodiesterase
MGQSRVHEVHNGPRLNIKIKNGIAIVFSDCHYWPKKKSTAHRALVKMVRELKPDALICNGDAVDMASVSRHPPIGWERRPTVQEEIEWAQECLTEILDACPKKSYRTWNLGNHDSRFETRLADKAPEYARVKGIHLHDHFPEWDRAWSTWINKDVVVTHRYLGGDNAPYRNTVRSGKTMITGHLHSAKICPYTDYNGTRFGVDPGCVADTHDTQFVNYTEDNPKNWISGFGVFTFDNYRLRWPELVTVWDKNHVQFRGKIIRC